MSVEILHGNCLARLTDLEDQSINTCITSPPYWGLRNYEEEDTTNSSQTFACSGDSCELVDIGR